MEYVINGVVVAVVTMLCTLYIMASILHALSH